MAAIATSILAGSAASVCALPGERYTLDENSSFGCSGLGFSHSSVLSRSRGLQGAAAPLVSRDSCSASVALDQRSGGLGVMARSGGGGGGQPYRPPRISSGPRRGPNQQQDSGRDDGPLMNTDIRVPYVRLLDEEQNMVGVVSTSEALQRSRDAELDLVMISPDADPPVVRIMDYSKYRYELQKKKREAQKKAAANRQVLKELKMRYNIDTHDYAVRQRAAQRFLKDGDKVKVVCQFKGREMDFKDLAVKLFQRFQEEIGALAVVETKISLEGKTMFMVLAPNKATIEKEKAAAQSQAAKVKSKAGKKSETTAIEEVTAHEEGTAPESETAQTLETPALETQASV
ncbi:unnamed protein product [Calypogeia fissa]